MDSSRCTHDYAGSPVKRPRRLQEGAGGGLSGFLVRAATSLLVFVLAACATAPAPSSRVSVEGTLYRIQVNGFSSGEMSNIQNTLSSLCNDGLEQIHKSDSTATYRFRGCGSINTAAEVDGEINKALQSNGIRGNVAYQDKEFTISKHVPPSLHTCVFPNTEAEAPGWVCYEPVFGVDVMGVGSAKPRDNEDFGPSFYRDMARARAQGDLINNVVTVMETRLTLEEGTDFSYTRQTIESVATGKLERAEILKMVVSPDGIYYALVGMKHSDVQRLIREVRRASRQ